jgi:UDP-N-acetylmuramoylalanine--D-glutamate ligase
MSHAADALRAAGASSPVILLSPGAPSFGPYRDYVERGRDFARIAGFDPDAISAIPGIGIA